MTSERPTEVEFEAKVMTVGGGTIVLARKGEQEEWAVPATKELEQWAAANLYKWVKVRIQMGSCLEPLAR